MGNVSDILDSIHVVITSVAQSIAKLKRHVDAFQSIIPLLHSAEEKTARIETSILSLKDFAKVSTLESHFFTHTVSSVQDVQHELNLIQSEIENKSSVVKFVFASGLRRRLVGINEQLHEIDHSLSVVGMIGDIVMRKLRKECLHLSEGMKAHFNELNDFLNRALKSDNPIVAAESILDSMRSGDIDNSIRPLCTKPVLDLLSSENEWHLFFLLGRSRYEGDCLGYKDFPRAARFLNAAFTQGCTTAAFYLGNLFYHGEGGVKRNYRISFGYYTVGAHSGDAAAMASLAWMYAFGCGVEVNGRLAVQWYNAAAEKGNGIGLWEAGYYALHGNATRKNCRKAVKHLRAAIKVGEHRAGNELALFYLNGIVVDRDPCMAHQLLRKSYECTGDVIAASYLGWLFESGFDIEQNFVHAAQLYKDIARRNTGVSRLYACYYGILLIRGLGVAKDVNTGLRLVRESLKDGHGCGWSVLAECYRFGYGVKRNLVKAIRFYLKAVSSSGGVRGIVNSDMALAEMYETGEGLGQSLTKAVHHYIRAANRMDRAAQWKAGSFFETGTGGLIEICAERSFSTTCLLEVAIFMPNAKRVRCTCEESVLNVIVAEQCDCCKRPQSEETPVH